MAEFKITRFDLQSKGILAQAGETHKVIVLQTKGKRILVEDTHFHTDSSLFLPAEPEASEDSGIAKERKFANDDFWNTLKRTQPDYVASAKEGEFIPPEEESETESDKRGAAGGLEVILAALKFLDANSDHALLVAGHTDRAGSEAHNEELSQARSECVCAVLEGDRAGYVQAAKKHDKPESDGHMLAFAARSRGFACRPANAAKPTAAEIKAFQKAYNQDFKKTIGEDGVVGDETRGAFFDVVDSELAEAAGDADTLKALRGKLTFVDKGQKTLACGERFPIDNPKQDGLASQTNRRVELLFFPPDLRPDLKAKDAAEQVYDKGTFDFERIDPESLETADGSSDAQEGELALEDASAPENGVGEMDGDLETEMAELQKEADPDDAHAFLDFFAEGFPEFGTQAVSDIPITDGDTVLV